MIAQKRGQAALEFLMTYGWAILVVLAAIAALAYFGVLSPEKLLPTKCLLETGFTCVSSKIEPTQAIIVLNNGIGKTIEITGIDIAGCADNTLNATMLSGNEQTFTITGCDNGVVRDVFRGEIEIDYTESRTGITKKAYGDIATKIE